MHTCFSVTAQYGEHSLFEIIGRSAYFSLFVPAPEDPSFPHPMTAPVLPVNDFFR